MGQGSVASPAYPKVSITYATLSSALRSTSVAVAYPREREGRTEATGRVVQYAMQEFFRHAEDVADAGLTTGLAGKRVVVQGPCNVVYHAAKFLQEEDNCLIVGIIERDGGLWKEQDLEVERAFKHLRENDGVKGYPDANYVAEGNSLLEAECDILVPAASLRLSRLGGKPQGAHPLPRGLIPSWSSHNNVSYTATSIGTRVPVITAIIVSDAI